MKSWMSTIIFSSLIIMPLCVSAAQVKGLELGTPYSDQELTRAFPGSRCFPHGHTGLSYCVLPTTFLGRHTSAEIMRDKKQRVIDFTAYLPAADETGALKILTARFGQPENVKRGDAVAHVWPEAEDGTLRLEAGLVNNELRINFYSSKIQDQQNAPLQASDL